MHTIRLGPKSSYVALGVAIGVTLLACFRYLPPQNGVVAAMLLGMASFLITLIAPESDLLKYGAAVISVWLVGWVGSHLATSTTQSMAMLGVLVSARLATGYALGLAHLLPRRSQDGSDFPV